MNSLSAYPPIKQARDEMIKRLQDADTPSSIIAAMAKVQRHKFATSISGKAYMEIPGFHLIGPESVLYPPEQCAQLLKAANVLSGQTVLQLGMRSNGYFTALLSELVGPDGKVFAVEGKWDCVLSSAENLRELNYSLSVYRGEERTPYNQKYWQTFGSNGRVKTSSGSITILHRDVLSGYPNQAPYDVILAAVALEDDLGRVINQLKAQGTFVVPVFADKLDGNAVKTNGNTNKANGAAINKTNGNAPKTNGIATQKTNSNATNKTNGTTKANDNTTNKTNGITTKTSQTDFNFWELQYLVKISQDFPRISILKPNYFLYYKYDAPYEIKDEDSFSKNFQ